MRAVFIAAIAVAALLVLVVVAPHAADAARISAAEGGRPELKTSDKEVFAVRAASGNVSDGSIWNKIKCDVCKKVVIKFVDFAVDHGCDAADGIASAACAAASGPVAPLCAAALIAGCSILVSDWVDHHIHDGDTLCKHIHMCK